jgi:alpha-tubulin suppressor-like RCC1 family protein/cation transport regulator ChaC
MTNPSITSSSAKWCPTQQIYIDGTIEQSSSAETHIQDVLANNLPLYIFGYGSLCWSPGGGILSHPDVDNMFGRAVGYQRCWGQKSADHRGDVHFNGLVCTLLSDEEVRTIVTEHRGGDLDLEEEQVQMIKTTDDDVDRSRSRNTNKKTSMTEGLVYTIPKELVKACLDELDFREKGGYARDLINVIVDVVDDDDGELGEKKEDTGSKTNTKRKTKTIQAMLYRGTPSNPLFSNRALLDELYAASVMAVAKGPSGNNDAYLYQLDEFLSASSDRDEVLAEEYIGDTQTKRLTTLAKKIQQDHQVYFLFGSGSNQHNQLLLDSSMKNYDNAAKLMNGDEAHDLKEIVLVVPKREEHHREQEEGIDLDQSIHRPKELFAGGGHSALLTHYGDLYLWGWNEAQQLGRDHHGAADDDGLFSSHPIVTPLEIKVESAALGHNHSLIIEKDTGFLYAFGEDNRGQASADISNPRKILTKIDIGEEVVEVSAGLFHSAAITKDGELVTFGCGRFGQTLTVTKDDTCIGRWRPTDGSRLVNVACGRRHTVVLDEFGRIYTMGENKYGQLGRELQRDAKRSQQMELVEGFLGQKGSGCIAIDCGWSHNIAVVSAENDGEREMQLFGWGRNDKSQCSLVNNCKMISTPQQIKGHIAEHGFKKAYCSAESISVLDGNNDIVSCGWNEHGNLGVGHSTDVNDFTMVKGARICSQFHSDSREGGKVLVACGGGHFFTTIVSNDKT